MTGVDASAVVSVTGLMEPRPKSRDKPRNSSASEAPAADELEVLELRANRDLHHQPLYFSCWSFPHTHEAILEISEDSRL